jgi:hypothetical protein
MIDYLFQSVGRVEGNESGKRDGEWEILCTPPNLISVCCASSPLTNSPSFVFLFCDIHASCQLVRRSIHRKSPSPTRSSLKFRIRKPSLAECWSPRLAANENARALRNGSFQPTTNSISSSKQRVFLKLQSRSGKNSLSITFARVEAPDG